MNTGQQAKRFIHATVAWNKAVGAEPYLQQAGCLYRYRLLYGHAQAKRLFKNHGLVFIFSDGLTCLLRLPFNIFPSYNRIGRQIWSFPLFSQRFGRL